MRRVKTLLSIAGLLFLTAAVLTVGLFIKGPTNIQQKAAAGTRLFISPATQEKTSGSDVLFAVQMDTGPNNVTGIDLLMKYDPSVLQIGSIKRGSGINALNNTINNNFDNSKGEITYTVFTLDKSQAINGGSVEVLQISAKVNSPVIPGSYLLSFDSSTAVSATGENQNSLVGTSPATVMVIENAPTATPTATAEPTSNPTGAPNSCNGTCGSNSNCGSNLFCYQGYCRNPSCSWATNCSCSATSTPTPVPTRTPTARPQATYISYATAFPTQEPIIIDYTPYPTQEPETSGNDNFWQNVLNTGSGNAAPTPSLVPAESTQNTAPNFLPWIIGSLVVAGVTLVFIVIGILREMRRGKSQPPVIKV